MKNILIDILGYLGITTSLIFNIAFWGILNMIFTFVISILTIIFLYLSIKEKLKNRKHKKK